MRRIARTVPILALALLAAALPVRGDICALDGGPAATLLLPYFEVDLDNPNGRTTVFSINNATEKAVVAHVVLWTDLAVPTLGFDVFLTGWDVQTLNLRDLFQGNLPRTADVARDPADTISPRGFFSLDSTFPGCASLPPQMLPADVVDHLRRAHTGQASPLLGGQCAGFNFDQPTVARGYATIDMVKDCTSLRPGDAGYFGADGVAGFDNVLWGDFFYVDPAGRFAQGENLVRLHAEPGRFNAGDATFYARLVNGSAADGREPLPRVWATRYLAGGGFDGGTDLVAWRDGPWTGKSFPCGSFPAGVPQSQKQVVAFDEEENPSVLLAPCDVVCPPGGPALAPLPVAASRASADGSDFSTPFAFGWILFDLGTETGGAADPFAQAWMGQVSSAQGRFSVGLEGTALGGACSPGRCSQGTAAEVGELCVLGPLQDGAPAMFTVAPKGCFSSSCTQVTHAGCAVERTASGLRLDALFCLQFPDSGTCPPDCSGGGTARCSSGTLAAGTYTATLGSLSLTFTVPSEAGACVGSRF
ncbi:MAG TPA: hypothetical protein VGG03_22805 [Thermoanaerobaculia bacterium]|jgi:hypothetical protein